MYVSVQVLAAHLLLAVKVAARAMPGSRFFRLVGESTLPVLRALECRGKALGWSSCMEGNIHWLHPELLSILILIKLRSV